MQTKAIQDMQLKMADGVVLNFKFGLGNARYIKEMTGVDPMKDAIPGDWYDQAVAIFIAAYMSACKAYKTPPAYTIDDLKDYFEELDAQTALDFVRAFNGVMVVKATAETVEAVREAENIVNSDKKEGEPTPN